MSSGDRTPVSTREKKKEENSLTTGGDGGGAGVLVFSTKDLLSLDPSHEDGGGGGGGVREEMHLMRGSFGYFHFGQDPRVDDRGWACAYRAIQMLLSWFKLSAHEDTSGWIPMEKKGILSEEVQRRLSEVPSIREIQRRLVEMGDKPSRFEGSRDWIGCCEAFLCLDIFLTPSVSSRILHLRDSDEACSPARLSTLVTHFQTQGTPVMIGGDGGGARVLLGVRYPRRADASLASTSTNAPDSSNQDILWKEMELLLIDPHYDGPDDLEHFMRQRTGGQRHRWFHWRNAFEFFKTHTFYNMCLPLRR